MFEEDQTARFKPGNVVRILNSGFGKAIVAEVRGRLGPKGAMVYRVQVRKKPYAAYTEVLEEQLELVPDEEANNS